MPSKYDYVNEQGGAVTFTLNEDDLNSITIDGDYTLDDDNMDQTILVDAGGTSVTLTLDVGNMRDGFVAYVVNQQNNDITINLDGSNFSGSTTLIGGGQQNAGVETTIRHIDPGVVSVA